MGKLKWVGEESKEKREIEEEMNEKGRMCGEISGKGAAKEDLWGLWRGWRRENGDEKKNCRGNEGENRIPSVFKFFSGKSVVAL